MPTPSKLKNAKPISTQNTTQFIIYNLFLIFIIQYNKQILEVINRGIRLAIDDIEDIDDSISSKSGII